MAVRLRFRTESIPLASEWVTFGGKSHQNRFPPARWSNEPRVRSTTVRRLGILAQHGHPWPCLWELAQMQDVEVRRPEWKKELYARPGSAAERRSKRRRSSARTREFGAAAVRWTSEGSRADTMSARPSRPAPIALVTFPERKLPRAVGRRGKRHGCRTPRLLGPAFAGMTSIESPAREREAITPPSAARKAAPRRSAARCRSIRTHARARCGSAASSTGETARPACKPHHRPAAA